MILCPNCLHKEMLGAFFCSECGAQLVYTTGVTTSAIRSTGGLRSSSANPSKPLVQPPPPPGTTGAFVSLNIISSGDILPLTTTDEVTLGRASEGQPIVPDIDLTPYKAYESGVSRMHATIRVVEDQVMVTDLGSANGTNINGMKISAHIPYPVRHGDILTLGKFKIQILYRNPHSGG
jgi:hypothetical protein